MPTTLSKQLIQGDRRSLAKAITLVESTLPKALEESRELLTAIMPKTGQSLRIGISGPPGVGKSTFIEAFGTMLCKADHKVAVLAVDPSSPISGGSILGDKTRMQQLASHDNAYIRPSPSSGYLGGVARNTRESILLCEAAGYSIILVETIGVGQSEVTVASMVDAFVILQLPNAGDELQGIKKGILELADIVVINKADGETKAAADRTRNEHEHALRLVRGESAWPPPVLTCSSLKDTGIRDVWAKVQEFQKHQQKSGAFVARRIQQAAKWFDDEVSDQLKHKILSTAKNQKILAKAKAEVEAGKIPASVGADTALDAILTGV